MSIQETNDAIKNIPHALLGAIEDSPIIRVATGILTHQISTEAAHRCLQDYSIEKMPKEAHKQLFELILDLKDATLTDQQLYQKILSLSDTSLQQLLYQGVTHALQHPAEEALKENPRLLLQLRTAKGLPLLHGLDFLQSFDPISTLSQEVAHAVLHSEPLPLLANRQKSEEEICKIIAYNFMEHLIPSDWAFRNLTIFSTDSYQKTAYKLLSEACISLKTEVVRLENESVRYFIICEIMDHISDFWRFRTKEYNEYFANQSQLKELTSLVIDNLPACALSHEHLLNILKFAMQNSYSITDLWIRKIATLDLSVEERYAFAIAVAHSKNKNLLLTTIKEFHFSKKKSFEIAMILLRDRHNAHNMIQTIENFAAAGTQEYEHILLECANLDSLKVYENRKKFSISPLVAAKIELLYAFEFERDDPHQLEQFSKAAQIAFTPLKHLFSKHIQQLFEDAKASETVQKMKHIQQVLFISTYVHLQQQGMLEVILKENSDILYTLSTYRQLPLAIGMLYGFCKIIKDSDALKHYHRLATHAHLREIAFMLCQLNVDVSDKKDPKHLPMRCVDTLHAFLTSSSDIRKAMRDVSKNYIPSILNAILSFDGTLNEEDCAPLLNYCAEGESLTLDAFVERLALSGALCALNKTEKLLNALSQSDKTEALKACFRQSLQEIVDLTGIENIEERYQQTFGSMHIPNALPIYIGGLIRGEQLSNVQEALTCMVRGVLLNTLPAERYTFDTPHIKALRERAPDVFAKWQHNPPAQSITLTAVKESHPSFSEILYTKIADGHLKPMDTHTLETFLRASFDEQVTLLASLQTRFIHESENPLLHIELLCSELCHKMTLPTLNKLKELLGKTFPGVEFLNDLKFFTQPQKPFRGGDLILVEIDNPLDLFLCGSEVMGSCQRVDGSASLNKCLLGYVLDGKTKMLVIKDLSGQVAGRCILRLLIDTETSQPLLFQERMYANGLHNTYEKALNHAAEQRAASLGIRLARASESSGEAIQVCSLGCPAPFEYEDGGEGVTNGTYTFSTHVVSPNNLNF